MSWLSRLTNAFSSRRLDDDLAEEFGFHLERRVEDLIRDGLAPEEARRRARREFGNVLRIHEDARSAHLVPALEAGVMDMRYSVRAWCRRPLTALVVAASIGVASGAAIAVYRVLDASSMQPLPVPRADDLVALRVVGPSSGAAGAQDPGLFSYPMYESLRVAASSSGELTLLDDPRPAEVQGADVVRSDRATSQFVAPDFFRVLDVPLAAGESFASDRDGVAAPLEVVLSYEYWTRQFGRDPTVLGRSLVVDGRPHQIVGVAASGFHGAQLGTFVDLWRSIRTFDPAALQNVAFRSFRLIGRLSPGVQRPSLAVRLDAAFRRSQQDRLKAQQSSLPPADIARLGAETLSVENGRSGAASETSQSVAPLWIVLALTAAILLIASANVASVMLARAVARQREMALRLILGASRLRVFGLVVIDGAALAAAGAGLGLMMSTAIARVLVRSLSAGDRLLDIDLTADARVWGFAVLLAAVMALVMGVLPAWRVVGWRREASPQQLGRQIVGSTTSRAVMAAQIAFAFALVMTGAAFVVSLRHLTAVPLGFEARNLAVFTMADDVGPGQRPLQLQVMRDLEARVAARAEVAHAAVAWWPLLSSARRVQRVALPGGALSEDQEVFYRVSPHYLETLRVPLLRGRFLSAADNDNEPVASVVSRAFALKYFGVEFPLGRVFLRDDGVRHQVVGVAGDSPYDNVRNPAAPIVYMPMKPTSVFTFYVRPAPGAGDLSPVVAAEARALGFGMRVRDATTLDALVQRDVSHDRLLAQIGGACAVLSLALGALGLFGMLNHEVVGRTAEFGLRSALGASRTRVASLVLRDAVWPVAGGLIAGTATSLTAIHAMRGTLFHLYPASVSVLGSAAGVFTVAAILACAVPIWRAVATDPAAALRRD